MFWRHVLASSTGGEDAGNPVYQSDHMSKIFAEGFSFSGFERDKLYLNQGGQYLDISGLSGLDSVGDGRGAAYADFDNDGDYDIFLTALQGQVHYLFRNEVGQRANWVRVALAGAESGPEAWGAEVRVKTSQGVLSKIKAGGNGFVSQSDPRLLFGLGGDSAAEWLEVRWPSGRRQRFGSVAAGSTVRITEGEVELQHRELAVASLPDPTGAEEALWASLAVESGGLFPDVALVGLDGAQTSFAEYRRDDRSYLVNLWATHCGPCLKEMPELEALSASLAADGIEVVGISLDMGQAVGKVPRFLKRLGVNYPVFTADETVFTQIFAGEQVFIPLSFIVDRQGRVVEAMAGWSAEVEAKVRALGQGE
ncbi:MAG: redoxin family protein [Candidatus Latescibacterota bacterium]|nr:redoxin family protein [Candidatus Latescibacterota bacterium]